MDLSDEVSKDGLNAIETLAQTVAKGSMNEADVQRLIEALSQLSESIAKVRDTLRDSSELALQVFEEAHDPSFRQNTEQAR